MKFREVNRQVMAKAGTKDLIDPRNKFTCNDNNYTNSKVVNISFSNLAYDFKVRWKPWLD
jgi:hypothetical protein